MKTTVAIVLLILSSCVSHDQHFFTAQKGVVRVGYLTALHHHDDTAVVERHQFQPGDSVEIIGNWTGMDNKENYILAYKNLEGMYPQEYVKLSETHSAAYPTSLDGKDIHTGKRGGKYYINESGKKTYVKKKK